MGIFSNKNEENLEKTDFYEEIKPNLETKDGNIHTIFIDTSYEDPFQATSKKMDNYMNKKIKYIISRMQKEGYEIIDVKFSIGPQINRSEVLVIYK